MPAPYPRRRWRFVLAGAVSAVLLAGVAGCGEPSHAGNASAAAPAADSPGSVAGSEGVCDHGGLADCIDWCEHPQQGGACDVGGFVGTPGRRNPGAHLRRQHPGGSMTHFMG